MKDMIDEHFEREEKVVKGQFSIRIIKLENDKSYYKRVKDKGRCRTLISL